MRKVKLQRQAGLWRWGTLAAQGFKKKTTNMERYKMLTGKNREASWKLWSCTYPACRVSLYLANGAWTKSRKKLEDSQNSLKKILLYPVDKQLNTDRRFTFLFTLGSLHSIPKLFLMTLSFWDSLILGIELLFSALHNEQWLFIKKKAQRKPKKCLATNHLNMKQIWLVERTISYVVKPPRNRAVVCAQDSREKPLLVYSEWTTPWLLQLLLLLPCTSA